MSEEKILTKHPLRKSGKNISKQKYEALKEAILSALQTGELTYPELSLLVASIKPTQSKKTCFVIGPMGEGQLERLKWLAEEVVQPILGDGYAVSTPDVNVPDGMIMDHVIRSCDRADLVVVDTTGNRPNVLYEMGILDAMGRACIPVKFKIDEVDAMPFDRAQYRYFMLEQETASAQAKLKEVLASIRWQIDRGEFSGNPITDCFEIPLSSLGSARGLASSYFRNFVAPCLHGEVIEGPAFARGKSKLQVQTVLPNRLVQIGTGSFEKVLKRGLIKDIVIETRRRRIAAYVWTEHRDDKNDPIVVDIPTPMLALFENVYARLGRGTLKDFNSPAFRALEDAEIRQFVFFLTIYRNRAEVDDESGLVRDNYRIINVADSFEPNLLD